MIWTLMEILSLLCHGLRHFSASRPNVSGIGRFDVNHPEPFSLMDIELVQIISTRQPLGCRNCRHSHQ